MQERRASLQSAVHSTTQKVSDTRERWRHLRLKRNSLQQRLISALQESPTTQHNTNPNDLETPVPPTRTACGVSHTDSAPMQRQNAQLVPKRGQGGQFEQGGGSNRSPLSGERRSAASTGQFTDYHRPVSSFERCESISFSAISTFMAHTEAPNQSYNYNLIVHAIHAYQQSVANRTGVHVDHICWFPQWGFLGTDSTLSFSINGSSPECILAGPLCFLLGGLESMFLVMEHEMLLEASDPFYEAPEHPGLATSDPLPTPPTPPDPGCLKCAYFRCGLNQILPVTEALELTLKPMLLKYRASLPRQRWRAVCMQTFRIIEELTEALHKSTGISKNTEVQGDLMDNVQDDSTYEGDATQGKSEDGTTETNFGQVQTLPCVSRPCMTNSRKYIS